ncbi:MAG: putative ABC transporter permease [Acholeplasmatales bacterium]|nr:putative ABC transporter permease [Acholeplasmatales bacterium]
MEGFITWFFYFTIYAFLGYICEVVYVAIITKKITNRGYLFGPIVPIYGYGAIIVLALLWNLRANPFLVILLGGLLTSGLEYLTSFFMELVFHMRWWDYSDKFMNLNGRICLRNSLMFIGLVVLVIYVLHPLVETLISDLMGIYPLYLIIFIIIISIQAVDTVISTVKHIKISTIIKKLEKLYESAAKNLNNFKNDTIDNFSKAKEYITNTRVYNKLSNLNIHYPSFKLRSKDSELKGNASNLIEKLKAKFGGEKDE